jgi:hypothetical protein
MAAAGPSVARAKRSSAVFSAPIFVSTFRALMNTSVRHAAAAGSAGGAGGVGVDAVGGGATVHPRRRAARTNEERGAVLGSDGKGAPRTRTPQAHTAAPVSTISQSQSQSADNDLDGGVAAGQHPHEAEVVGPGHGAVPPGQQRRGGIDVVVSEVSRYLFEESGGLLSDDLPKLCGSTRSSLRRRGWAAFLSRAALAVAAGRCGTSVVHDADNVSSAALTSAEIELVDHEMSKVAGWSAHRAFVAHLGELAAMEGRHELVHALLDRLGVSIADARDGREPPLRGEVALRRAADEAVAANGPCPHLNAARAKHLFRLTRRGEQGWRAADAHFSSLRRQGLASWEIVATLLPTIPSLADQRALVSQVRGTTEWHNRCLKICGAQIDPPLHFFFGSLRALLLAHCTLALSAPLGRALKPRTKSLE